MNNANRTAVNLSVSYSDVYDIINVMKEIGDISVEQTGETKGNLESLSTFLIKIASANAADSFIKGIISWLSRDKSRYLELQIGENKITASGLTAQEQRDLITWFQQQTGMRFEH